MLTDAKLKNIKGTGQPYKVADRDGLYAMVAASGGISFRYNYRVNGRQETVTLARYGVGGMSLREALVEARKAVAAGVSPARTKEESIRRRKAQEPFSVWPNAGSTNTGWPNRRAPCAAGPVSVT